MIKILIPILVLGLNACTFSPKIDVGVINDQVGSLKGSSAKGYVDIQAIKCSERLWVKCEVGYYHLSGLLTGPPFDNEDEGAIEGPYFNLTILEL